nr:GNAT family N-acetyltransferase [Azonexus fungiphilus]
MLNALAAITNYFSSQGYTRLTYKVVPVFYHRIPSQDDIYALFRLGAVRVRCDLSSTIDLSNRGSVSQRRRRSLKKAYKADVRITTDVGDLSGLWEVLSENLARKHGVSPVHSLSEITVLSERFPENIQCVCGKLNGKVVAGVLFFATPTAHHAQYIASNELGYQVSALDMVFEYCIEQASQLQKKWFDFGISTEAGGTMLNESLYRFKTEFGAGGFVHEFYEIELGKKLCQFMIRN